MLVGDPEWISKVQGGLRRWYRAVARDLPWRRTRDPYAIWVSEIMLQQTQVATVIPYYERFMARFPTVEALARAPQDELFSLWAGLGYYRRARFMHEAAQQIMERHGGTFPSIYEDIRALKGVGPYTAGAIVSIAFRRATPAVDGNVIRVLSRLFALEGCVDRSATQREIWSRAAQLVPTADPGEHNQALMELGASHCRPLNPECGRCPIQTWCVAHAEGRVAALPQRPPKKRPTEMPLAALLLYRLSPEPEIFVLPGDGEGLWPGLWGPPLYAYPAGHKKEEALAGALGAGGWAVGGLQAAALSEIGQLTHLLTHRRLKVRVFVTLYNDSHQLPEGGVWEPLWREGEALRGISRLSEKAWACFQRWYAARRP